MGRASHGPIATTSGGPASGRKVSPEWYNPEKYGAGWIPLMRHLDNQMKTAKTGPYAKKEKLKIKPAPTNTTTNTTSSSGGGGETTTTTTPSGSGGTTTTQDLQIDPKKDDQKGGGQKPPKKKKPPKKDAGNPSDTSGGSSAGDANL